MSGSRVTGFTRFLIFMVLFVPTVVFGVLYAKYGEEGLSMTKAIELFSGEQEAASPEAEIKRLEKEIDMLEQKIDKKKARIAALKE